VHQQHNPQIRKELRVFCFQAGLSFASKSWFSCQKTSEQSVFSELIQQCKLWVNPWVLYCRMADVRAGVNVTQASFLLKRQIEQQGKTFKEKGKHPKEDFRG
jgi:hypothetical protein